MRTEPTPIRPIGDDGCIQLRLAHTSITATAVVRNHLDRVRLAIEQGPGWTFFDLAAEEARMLASLLLDAASDASGGPGPGSGVGP